MKVKYEYYIIYCLPSFVKSIISSVLIIVRIIKYHKKSIF